MLNDRSRNQIQIYCNFGLQLRESDRWLWQLWQLTSLSHGSPLNILWFCFLCKCVMSITEACSPSAMLLQYKIKTPAAP